MIGNRFDRADLPFTRKSTSMKHLETTVPESALPEPTRAPWGNPTQSPPGSAAASGGHLPCVGYADRLNAPTTASYAAETFAALDQAIHAVQSGQSTPLLDALAMWLQKLSVSWDYLVAKWTQLELDPGVDSAVRRHATSEKAHAAAVAVAVRMVRALVRTRALGELDQSHLNAAWSRTWESIAIPPPPSNQT